MPLEEKTEDQLLQETATLSERKAKTAWALNQAERQLINAQNKIEFLTNQLAQYDVQLTDSKENLKKKLKENP